jgi:ABC-type transporter Mla subunit MlaD
LASHWIEVNNVFAEERKQLLEKISELQQEEKLLQEQVKKLETALQKSVDTPVYTITGNESTANDYSEDQVSQFIAKMQRDFESETHSVVCLTSSTPEEINSYKEQLEYRVSWLQVLLEEAEKELKLLYILFTY